MKFLRTCYILRGTSGSGKSTYAKELQKTNSNLKVVSADNFWIDSKGFYNFDVKKLSESHKYCFDEFKKAVQNGFDVAVDNTNLKYSDFTKYIDYLILNNNQNDYIYSVNLVEISYNDLETVLKIRQNNSNGKNLPESKIRDHFKLFKKDVKGMILRDYKGKISLNSLDEISIDLPWKSWEDQKELSKRPAIICDLDGTLSIFEYTNGIQLRDCYDASTSNSDIISVPVASALKGFFYTGYEIIFVSGREDIYRKSTEEFLKRVCEEYEIEYNYLHMRKAKDYRKDFIIKQEIYEKKIKENFNVLAVFDDREQVIKMWKELGLFVFNCNYRGVEF